MRHVLTVSTQCTNRMNLNKSPTQSWDISTEEFMHELMYIYKLIAVTAYELSIYT